MEHLLPHEIAERELEIQEGTKIKERREEELRVVEDEVENTLSVEESVVEYQRKLWCSHYYEYYNLEGGANDEDKDNDSINFRTWDVQSCNGGISLGQVIDFSCYISEA
ncbi:DNA-directed RNA polymerase II subunit RPB1 [Hordeum vulgare]|nr:DNA-directed RNA polymerase II subunit RPB1 [Hordeum vulgare]